MKSIISLIIACMAAMCGAYAQEASATREFTLPDIPTSLTAPQERADYLATHYWDSFDFGDTLLIDRPEVTEQAFVDFVSILPHTPKAAAAIDTLYSRAAAERSMLYHFISLGEKYLYDPASPMCDESLYVLILHSLIASPCLDEADKARPRHRLEMAKKNRPGDVAADFTVCTRQGTALRLHELKADYILLYLNNPDCNDCRLMKLRLSASSTLSSLLEAGTLQLLSVCVEGKSPAWDEASLPALWIDACDETQQISTRQLYDLKRLPTLYLLDTHKRVLLKDASVQQIEERLGK